jgi:hypothetical protein
MSGLVGKEESKNVAPLGPELDRVAAAPIRKLTLRLLQESEGSAPKIESLLRERNGIPPQGEAVEFQVITSFGIYARQNGLESLGKVQFQSTELGYCKVQI